MATRSHLILDFLQFTSDHDDKQSRWQSGLWLPFFQGDNVNKIDEIKQSIEILRIYRKNSTIPNSGLERSLKNAIECMEVILDYEKEKEFRSEVRSYKERAV